MPDELPLVRDFAVVMAVAGVALVLFRKLGQPAILGYLLAGLVVGPFVLSGLSVHDVRSVRLLADLGLVLLLFALGLEFGWQRIRRIGLRVTVIGSVEMAFMMALGYQTGTWLGLTSMEAVFLGAALSISSSAVLSKVLRDTGKLHEPYGRLIVGILVVEDFAAVVLLSVLAGLAATGTASASDVVLLLGKLALFVASTLVLGQVLVPRIIKFVAGFHSQEVLLIASLALCFGVALVAQGLELSAAAGAFLVGTVLGDTAQSKDVMRAVVPVRDVFAALFFVSIGMLVDPALLGDFVVPALVVSAVFIVGKVLANTLATFMMGHDTRTSLSTGMGMAQIGEFSLAMAKVGTDRGAVSPLIYPLVTVTTAITSVAYPFVFRSSGAVATFLEKRWPRVFTQYVASVSYWLASLRATAALRSEAAGEARRLERAVFVNLGVIAVLLGVGSFVLGFAPQLSALLGVQEAVAGLIVGSVAVVLCFPPAVVIWRCLGRLPGCVGPYLARQPGAFRQWRLANLVEVFRGTVVAVMVVFLAIWSLPFIFRLLSLGLLTSPLPILWLAVLLALAARSAFRIHAVLEQTFGQTFVHESDDARGTTSPKTEGTE